MTGLANRLRQLLKAAGSARPDAAQNASGSARVPGRTSGPRWADQEGDPFASPGDPQNGDTLSSMLPGHRDRSRRAFIAPYYFWGTLALLAAGFAVGGVVLHAMKDSDQNSAVTGTGLPDPLLPLQETAREALLRPAPELAAELKRSFLGKPDALCTELQGLGLTNRGWGKAPFHKDRWQCASDLVPLTTPSVDYGATTLFLLLRGPSEDRIDYLRMKLVVEDPRQKEIGLGAVWLVIDALAGHYGWTVPDNFRKAVSGFSTLETRHHGVQLSVAPEDPNLTDDPLASRRLNIIMDFGEPDLIRPADRFEQAPPLESGWSIKDPDGQAGE